MKSLWVSAVLAALLLWPALGRHEAAPAAGESGDTVIVLQEGDWRLDAAKDCLKQMLTSDWEYGRTDLRGILEAAGFSLTKVTVREVKQDPARIRFGYEFANADVVKTLYWEADCRVADRGSQAAPRQE